VRLRRPSPWRVVAALAGLFAGLLFVTSAQAARGTDLRGGRRLQLVELIRREQRVVSQRAADAAALRAEVEAQTAQAAKRNAGVGVAQQAGDRLVTAAGLAPLAGPGVEVALDDAPRLAKGEARQGNPTPDDLVVHQQDVQGVINALWAGGADAVSVMGKRIIATSSVQCVGNTLFLQDAVYSPPFVIAAIGDPERLEQALAAEPSVQLFRQAVEAWDLGFRVERRKEFTIPAYDGPLTMTHATPLLPARS
jgi:uncharacterized protein YlxW (UPF0749 family)